MTIGTDAITALTGPTTISTRWGAVTIGTLTTTTGTNGEEIVNVWPGPAAGDPTWRLVGLTDPDHRGGLAVIADAIAVHGPTRGPRR